MAREPNDLVLRILKEIQKTQAQHSREFEQLKIGQKEIRESVVTALGLSAHANVRVDVMDDRIGKIDAMIEELEQLKARVTHLETQGA